MSNLLFSIFVSLILGFVPSLIWLIFWLREDPHPEPNKCLVRAFIAGMAAVPGAIVFQYIALMILGLDTHGFNLEAVSGTTLILVILMWAGIEEIIKFAVCVNTTLLATDDNEPIDPAIYMITTALGFAGLENAMFILSSLTEGNIASAIASIDMRFVGATLVHILCSGIIGVTLGFTFYQSRTRKITYTILGVILATLLHSGFNLLIINSESGVFGPFSILWVMVIILILIIEKLKYINK